MESKEYLFSTGTAAKGDDAMSKCPSKSPSKRGGDKKYDSRNQMIMVAGPTGKKKLEKQERNSFSPEVDT